MGSSGGLSSTILMNNAAGAAVINEAATSTNPTLTPNRVEPDTGVGWASDKLHLVLGGADEYEFNTTAADFNSNNVTNMGTLNTYTILNMARNSQWVFPGAVSGTGAAIGTVARGASANFGDNDVAEQAAFFSAYAPTGFTTLTKAVLRIIATAVDTSSSGNVRLEFFTNIDADGEGLNGTQVNVSAAQYALTLNVWDDLDIEDLGVFAGLAAGDLIQLRVQRVPNNAADTVETVSIAGVLLEWT